MRFAMLTLPLLLMILAGCASYTPLPLPTHPDLDSSTAALSVPAKAFDTPGVHVTHVDLAQPLDAADVAVLAVLNNPALSALRSERGLATAQSYAAGLLPWPQIELSTRRPAPGGTGLHAGWSLSLSAAFASLLQHSDAEQAAAAHETQVRLNVLWNEWQVAQQARLLYAKIEYESAQLENTRPLLALYAERAHASHAAFRSGGLSRAEVTSADTAYNQLLTQADTLTLNRNKNLAALTALLGLAPHTPIRLALGDHPTPVNTQALPVALAALLHRRPDLMALAAAYHSADARLRQAVLAQFPLIGVSLSRERDTEGVISNGLSVTLTLPFLNDARGQVAVAQATRQNLHAIYQARLDATVSEAASLGDAENALRSILARVQRSSPALAAPTDIRPGAVPAGKLATYLANRRQAHDELAGLRYTLDQTTIALDTLLGMPLEAAQTLSAAPT